MGKRGRNEQRSKTGEMKMWELMELLLMGRKAWRWYTAILVILGLTAIGYALVV